MKKIFALATAGFSVLLLSAPAVSAAVHPTSTGYLDAKTCTRDTSPELCMWANGTSGDAVWANPPESSNNAEQTDQIADQVCGGTSESTDVCPFQVGSGLNAAAGSNHLVFILSDAIPGLCFPGRDTAPGVVQATCGGTGDLYVAEGQGHGDAYFINVLASNDAHQLEYACDGGAGQRLDLQPNKNATCLWYLGA
jgi:hypothetical protein